METYSGTHEQFDKRDDVKVPTESSFGRTFAVVFALLAAFSFWRHGISARFIVTGAISISFAVVTLIAPRILRPLNLIWLKFGLLLHKIVNPLVMGILFFGVFAPMGFFMRLFGADLLRMKRLPTAGTYWIARGEDRIPDSSMKNQF